MSELFVHIKKLIQVENEPVPFRAGRHMKDLPAIDDAFLMVDGMDYRFWPYGCIAI